MQPVLRMTNAEQKSELFLLMRNLIQDEKSFIPSQRDFKRERLEMKRVEPLVIKLAESKLDQDGVKRLAEHYTALDWFGRARGLQPNDSEFLIELAGRACYKSFGVGINPNITKIRDNSKDYLTNVLEKGDGSILEHATVTFAFLNVSRVFTHEIVRHRAGTAMSQESLRYVRPRDISLWMPPDIEPASDKVSETVKEIERRYHDLETAFDWERMNFEQKKRVTSALRRILPDGIATNLIWTANHRTLRWVIEMRTDPSAEVEIRKVFGKVAEICMKDYPLLYGDFTGKKLDDGTTQYVPKFSKV
jgi:thymidylate synthase (FAD)